MEVDKQEHKILGQAIDEWEETGKLSPEKAEELRNGLSLKITVRQQIAQYLFIVAVSCTILAFAAIFIDDKLLERIKTYFALSNVFIAIICAALATSWFLYVK